MVSENVRNRLRDDAIVVPVFSSGRLGPTRVHLPIGAGGIEHDGVLFCEEITTVDRDLLVHGPMGRPVPRDVMDQVVRAVRRAVGEVIID